MPSGYWRSRGRPVVLDRALEQFLEDAGWTLRGGSAKCLRTCLNGYMRWAQEQGLDWRAAGCAQITRYLASMIDWGASHASLISHRWMLWRLYRWGSDEGLCAANPMLALAQMRRGPRNPPRWTPTVQQMRRLLAAPCVATPLGVRDRCALELLYATGMRAGELVTLQRHQVDMPQRSIQIRGKGGAERIVIYGQPAAHWLEHYLQDARPHLIASATGNPRPLHQVFVHPTRGLAMEYLHLYRMIRGYGRQLNMPLLTPHALRHAFATHMKDGGADLRTVQMLLGHAHLSTTTIYLRSSTVGLRALIERHHPRGEYYEAFKRRTQWSLEALQRREAIPSEPMAPAVDSSV